MGKRVGAAESGAEAEKIARERRVLEAARHYSSYFPSGELLRDHRPDWLIPSASLGIEISDLVPAKPAGAKFSGSQLASFQEKVVITAERFYYSSADAEPADVAVAFENEWMRRRDVKQAAQALASFVRSNYPRGAQESVTLEPLNSEVRGWVDGLSVVRILRAKRAWQAGGCSGIDCVTHHQVAERIAAKDLLLPEYRRRWPGWQMWLLLSTRRRALRSVSIPREVTAWLFNSEFDKLLLSSWEGEVVELQRMPRGAASTGSSGSNSLSASRAPFSVRSILT